MKIYLLWLQLACCQASLSVLNMPTKNRSLPLLLIQYEYTLTNRKCWHPFLVNIPLEMLKGEALPLTFYIFLNFTNVLLCYPTVVREHTFYNFSFEIFSLKIYWDLFCGWTYGLSWIMVHVCLRRMCILLRGMFYRCLLGQVDL